MKERPTLTWRELEQNQNTKSEGNRPRGKKREKEEKDELILIVGSNRK